MVKLLDLAGMRLFCNTLTGKELSFALRLNRLFKKRLSNDFRCPGRLSTFVATPVTATTDIVSRIVVCMTSHLLNSQTATPKGAAAILTTSTAFLLDFILISDVGANIHDRD